MLSKKHTAFRAKLPDPVTSKSDAVRAAIRLRPGDEDREIVAYVRDRLGHSVTTVFVGKIRAKLKEGERKTLAAAHKKKNELVIMNTPRLANPHQKVIDAAYTLIRRAGDAEAAVRLIRMLSK